MSSSAPADAHLICGKRGFGKTTLAEHLSGSMKRPVVYCGNPEWEGFGATSGTYRDFRQCIERALKQRERPPESLYVGPRRDVEKAIEYITGDPGGENGEGVERGGIGCTLLIDEIYRFIPRRGKSNPHLIDALKRGRHLPPGQGGISVVGTAHKPQDVDPEMIEQAALSFFRLKQANAVQRASRYFHESVQFDALDKYEFVNGSEGEWLTYGIGPCGGPEILTLDTDSSQISQIDSFPRP